MIKKYNDVSLATGIPGLVIQVIGYIANQPIIIIIGTILLLFGFAYYAKAKGRHPAWCLMAFLSLIGLIVLGLLKDYAKETTGEIAGIQCTKCKLYSPQNTSFCPHCGTKLGG